MKHFVEWANVKAGLDALEHEPPIVSEGDVWWTSIGENVGHEIDGKGVDFARPAVIHTKLSKETFLVIPTTTQEKQGDWYVWFDGQEKHMAACLQQVRVVDYRRLLWRIETLRKEDFMRIKSRFDHLYANKNNPPPTY